MKKQNFKKIISIILAFMMISSIFAMVIPVSAADVKTINVNGVEKQLPYTLQNNTDQVINGITYRFDVFNAAGQNSEAIINEDGTITLKMQQGDLFWMPGIGIGEDSVVDVKVTRTGSVKDFFAGLAYNINAGTNGAWDEDTDSLNTMQLMTAYRSRVGKGTAATMKNNELTDTLMAPVAHYTDDGTANGNISEAAAVAVANNDTANKHWQKNVQIEMKLALNSSDNNVYASFINSNGETFVERSYEVGEDPYVFDGPVGYAISYNANVSRVLFRIDSFDITNAVVDGEKMDFSLSSSLTNKDTVGVVAPMNLTKTGLEFDGEYGFIDLDFTIDETVTSDTELVVKKNGEVIDRKALSAFAPVDGLYEYFTYFTDIQSNDVLTVCLEKDNVELEWSSYDVAYGAEYEKYKNNPVLVSSSNITSVIYSEDFSTPIVLQPGENIVNGHKWIYVKNSTDGSAVIKDEKLYFTGSNYDMILFEDIDVDNRVYKMVYDVTYLNTPSDDDWSAWDCWFGGVFYVSDTDNDGNKSAFITSITPNDVYMMDGKFDANGAFTKADTTSSHVTFLNDPASPTQGFDCYYWGERAGNGIPVEVSTFFGAANKDNGGVGMDGYTAQGSHVVSANLPGSVPSADRKSGAVGFVCSESQVSVVVSNLSVSVESRTITVEGEQVKVPKTGEFDVTLFKKADKQFVYATVDGNLKYAGDAITANRLTQITTTQIAISTNKVVAVGQTGLKWTSQISKADYEKLTSDTNISKVEVGTAVVLTDKAGDGITIANATKNIAGTATLSGDNYVFEGVLDIDKDARDTSYSAVGYVKVTMTDGKEIVLYADYVTRQHAYALSDLVDEFIDDEPAGDNGSDDTTANESTNTDSSNEATDGATEEKKGCGSSVFGFGAMLIVIVSVGACVLIPKKSKE